MEFWEFSIINFIMEWKVDLSYIIVPTFAVYCSAFASSFIQFDSNELTLINISE